MKWPSGSSVAQFSVALLLLFAVGETSYYNVRKKAVSPNSTSTVPSTRIHGGYDAPEEQFKFMVFLLVSYTKDLRDPTLTCSASLIHEKWILTAAHCVLPGRKGPPSIIAFAGRANLQQCYRRRVLLPFDVKIDEEELGVQERRVTKVFINPLYSEEEANEGDLALLLVDEPFRLGRKVQTARLSRRRMKERMPCTVLGWGLSDYQVQTFKLMFAEPVYAQTPATSCVFIKSGPYICLDENGSGICQGDSGSPLMCNGEIWGVASFSYSRIKDPACGNAEEEYYSQVYPRLKWMDDVMADEYHGSSSPTSSSVYLIQSLVLLVVSSALVL